MEHWKVIVVIVVLAFVPMIGLGGERKPYTPEQEAILRQVDSKFRDDASKTRLLYSNVPAKQIAVGGLANGGNVPMDLSCFQPTSKKDRLDARDCVSDGKTRLAMNEVMAARKCFERAVVLDPVNIEAHEGLGVVYIRVDEPDLAAYEYKKIKELRETIGSGVVDLQEPAIARDYVICGRELGRENKLLDAIVCFRRAIALEPTNIEAHYFAGLACLKFGLKESARGESGVLFQLDARKQAGELNRLIQEWIRSR